MLLLLAQFAPDTPIPAAWFTADALKASFTPNILIQRAFKNLRELLPRQRGGLEYRSDAELLQMQRTLLAEGRITIPTEGALQVSATTAQHSTQSADTRHRASAISQCEQILIYTAPRFGENDYLALMEAWLPHALYRGTPALERSDNQAAALAALIGLNLMDSARYSEAEPWLVVALEIRRKGLGSNHPVTSQSMNNLALLYRIQNDYARAIPLYEEALQVRSEPILREEKIALGVVYNNLGAAYAGLGNHASALPHYEKALALWRQYQGARHPDTAIALNNIAEVYVAQQDFARALPMHEEALSITREVYGWEHPATAQSMNNIGSVHFALAQYEPAAHHYMQALGIFHRVVGDNHPDTALAHSNLGAVHKANGRLALALQFYETSHNTFVKILGADHPTTRQMQREVESLRTTVNS